MAVRKSALAEAERLTREVVALYKQGKYKEALPLAERVLALREGAEKPDEAKLALALGNLATVRLAVGDSKGAKPLLERAVSLYNKQPEADALQYSQALQRLAALETSEQNYARAESLYERAVQVEEKALGPTHPNLGVPLLKLADFAHYRSEFKRARTFFGRALDAYDKLPKPVSESVVATLESYMCKMIEVAESEQKSAFMQRIGHITADPPQSDIEPTANIPSAENRLLRGGILTGKAISRATPEYPVEARQTGVQGTVVVRIVVDEKGNVTDAKAICGYDVLRKVSIQAARRWKFSPTQLSGVPVKVTGTISFNFIR